MNKEEKINELVKIYHQKHNEIELKYIKGSITEEEFRTMEDQLLLSSFNEIFGLGFNAGENQGRVLQSLMV